MLGSMNQVFETPIVGARRPKLRGRSLPRPQQQKSDKGREAEPRGDGEGAGAEALQRHPEEEGRGGLEDAGGSREPALARAVAGRAEHRERQRALGDGEDAVAAAVQQRKGVGAGRAAREEQDRGAERVAEGGEAGGDLRGVEL